jgi:aminoglycoside phosphotransferase (APT) family kinase protein
MLISAGRGRIAAMDRDQITADVAARLVADQFPQWADLPVVPVALNGWDNTTFRLGEELSVRLPSADYYVGSVDKEQRWLPVLARHLPLPIPEPVALGRPNSEFPRPWAIYRWIEGEPSSVARIADLTEFAADVAGFLAALHAIDASGGPPGGSGPCLRGGPLTAWDQPVRESIQLLADDIDADAVTEVWDTALASRWERPPVWVHGDVVGSNLLVADGVLRAVIDFGTAAVGDPACDLGMAWKFFPGDSAKEFRRGMPFDIATWARGRGWVLWQTLFMIAGEKNSGSDAQAAARKMGWRNSPQQVIDIILADHNQSKQQRCPPARHTPATAIADFG